MRYYLEKTISNMGANIPFLFLIPVGIAISVCGASQDYNLIRYLGFLVIILGLLIFLIVSVPKIHLNKYNGEKIPFDKVSNTYPYLHKIGIVGKSFAGKSTLSEFIRNVRNEQGLTSDLSVYITTNDEYPVKYIGVFDASGTNEDHQFKIAKKADILIIMVDHCDNDYDINYSEDRLRMSSLFYKQIRTTLTNENIEVKNVILLLNKSDLWLRVDNNSVTFLRDWFATEVQRWKDFALAKNVFDREHSNTKNRDDCAYIYDYIKNIL